MNYPNIVTVAGKEYVVNIDWRNALRICISVSDEKLDDTDRAVIQLRLFYRDFEKIMPEITKNGAAFFKAMRVWLKCGETDGKESDKILNYRTTWPYIVAAFKANYNMDIEATETLHFWKWRAMFLNLSPDNFFCQIIGRCLADISSLKGKDRKPYLDARREYAHWFIEEEVESDDEAIARVLNERII